MVTPRKNSSPDSVKSGQEKGASRAKTAPYKTTSEGGNKSVDVPAKTATVDSTNTPVDRPKRVVTTASALEAGALRQPPVAEPLKPGVDVAKPIPAEPEGSKASAAPKGAEAPAAEAPAKTEGSAKAKAAASPKPASRSKATVKSQSPTAVSASKPASKSKSSVSGGKASGVTPETAQPAKKAAIVTEQQTPAAPAKVAAVAKAEPKDNGASKAPVAAGTPAKPDVAASKVDTSDVPAFGTISLEPFTELWKAPEVDTMVSATQDAFEGSLTAVNEVLVQMAEKISEQADVFSDAGTHMMARYEDMIESHQKSLEGVWQVSSDLMEKSGSFGVELASWAQRELDASQADFEALSKIESLSELQELNERIFKRYVDSGMSEGEKIQKMMFAAFTDGFAAISRVAGVPLK